LLRSASQSNSVSKNHASSSTRCSHPRRAQRPPAPLLLEAQHLDLGELLRELLRAEQRAVAARVVGNRQLERERELALHVAVQLAHARRERALLVVNRDHDLNCDRR
jgi:hypothetical protein